MFEICEKVYSSPIIYSFLKQIVDSLVFNLFIRSKYTYLKLILIWGMPIIILQWIIGSDILIYNTHLWLGNVIYNSIYFAITDRWALKNKIWIVNKKYSLPLIDSYLNFEG